MASLKELRNRIASVRATQKITRAMQMVAASKLRRAHEAASTARPYAHKMDEVIANLAAGVDIEHAQNALPLLVGTGADTRHLLVVATAERGLCGGFNAQIARLARAHADALGARGCVVEILCVGRKGYEVLRRTHSAMMRPLITYQGRKQVGFAEAEEIATQILNDFNGGKIDVCTLFYAEFESVLSQVPVHRQLIPAVLMSTGENDNSPEGVRAAYDYEPDEIDILDALLPRNLMVQVLRALLENAASEQGARMSAMDSATRNAGDMIDNLTITYNRSRQAQITKELIEIISGAEAL